MRSSEEDQGTSLLEKPVRAEYTRLFELSPGDPKRQLVHALAAAAAAGWTVDDDAIWRSFRGNLVQSGERRLPTGRARLSITVFPRGTSGGMYAVPRC